MAKALTTPDTGGSPASDHRLTLASVNTVYL